MINRTQFHNFNKLSLVCDTIITVVKSTEMNAKRNTSII